MGRKKGEDSKKTGLGNRYAAKMLGFIPDKILPEGWIAVYHVSGAIVYLHRETRVVTWSRPYVIQKETSLKKHDIPLMSIPCLHQKSMLPEETSKKDSKKRTCPVVHGVDVKKQRLDVDTSPATESNTNHTDTNGIEETKSDNISETPLDNNLTNLNINHSEVDSTLTNENICSTESELSLKKDNDHTTNMDTNNTNTTCPFSKTQLTSNTNTSDVDSVSSPSIRETSPISDSGSGSGSGSEEESRTLNQNTTDVAKNEKESTSILSSKNTDKEKNGNFHTVNFVDTSDPNEISPYRMHNYLAKIFEFDILTREQGQSFVMSSEPSMVEATEINENFDKKLATDGKTPYQVLNEYCQKELRALPTVHKIERLSKHDFTVEICIKNFKYGIASGDTLREAKHFCASSTLNIFDYEILNEEEPSTYLTIFDKIPSDDVGVLPTIEEFSPMGVKYPYDILIHFLERNFAPDFEESHLEFTTETIDERLQKYSIKYKEYKAEGECENWKQVKQIAAQALILVLYPDLKNWGSVIRLMEVYTDLLTTRDLENETKMLKPGKSIVHVLRQEMRKIAAM